MKCEIDFLPDDKGNDTHGIPPAGFQEFYFPL